MSTSHDAVPREGAQVVLVPLSDPQAELCCPVCRSVYVHPLGVVVEQGQTRTEVRRESTTTLPTDRSQYARGSLIGLVFGCESGHDFQYEFEFHKGSTTLRLEAWARDPQQVLPELWRN